MYQDYDNSLKVSPAPTGGSVDKNPIDRFCNFISWLLVPLLTPVYAVLLLEFYYSPLAEELENKFWLPFYVFLITAVAPAIIFELLKRFGVLSDIALNKQRERTVPYIVVFLSYAVCTIIALYLSVNLYLNTPVLFEFFLGCSTTALLNFIYNFRWKISAHAAGVGGIVAVLINVLHHDPSSGGVMWLCLWLLLCGLLGFARIWLRRHTLNQVLAGLANGFICMSVCTLNI